MLNYLNSDLHKLHTKFNKEFSKLQFEIAECKKIIPFSDEFEVDKYTKLLDEVILYTKEKRLELHKIVSKEILK